MKRCLHSWTSRMVLSGTLLLCGCATTLPGSGGYDDKFSRALEAIQSVEYERAEGLLVSINEREPDHAGVWANLGIVWAQLERESEAVQALEKAVSLNPGLATAHNLLGVLHRRAGRFAQAEQAYLNALEADPELASTHRNIGVLYDLYLANPDRALEHYQRLIELDQTDEQVAHWIVELERRRPVREAYNQ